LLQAGGHVDGIAGHQELASGRVARADHLACSKSESKLQPAKVCILPDTIPQGNRGGKRPDGIVTVGAGQAKDGHHGVTYEFLERSSVR
jgi:hypothetical protein